MLDHSYFLSEIEVILALVDSLRTSLFQQRGNNKGTPAEWKVLEHTKTQLLNLQSYFRLLDHFEPKDYITALEDAYKGLDSVRTHNRVAQDRYLSAVFLFLPFSDMNSEKQKMTAWSHYFKWPRRRFRRW